ncbi:unnamed protein product [Cylicocyclus nassatus]|uniref:Uncharacterized protein n=1 Tax=Cylicocyclus nassatus TaxID=53992 RepID=A0AA36H719_CYLNA|nr:unnamed protein product [Cylicocyclus nassatus]
MCAVLCHWPLMQENMHRTVTECGADLSRPSLSFFRVMRHCGFLRQCFYKREGNVRVLMYVHLEGNHLDNEDVLKMI